MSAPIDLPETGRPGPAAIVSWYEKALAAKGASTERLEDGSLEFTTDFANTVDRSDWTVLEVVSGGTLHVEPTRNGYRVHVQARPRLLTLALSIVCLAAVLGAFASGAMSLHGSLLTFLLGFAGLPVVLIAWGFAWVHLHAVVVIVGREIEEAYTRPPTRRAAEGQGTAV